MSTRAFHDDAAQHAALYALGCLTAPEATAFEEHIAGCPDCEAVVKRCREVTSALFLLAPTADPPRGLRDRLLERVAALADERTGDERTDAAGPTQSWKSWAPTSAEGGPVFVPAGDTGWEPIGVAGVSAKGLFVDPANDRVTLLVRMEPGATYPSHRHGGAEECFLLEGDLSDGEVHMHAGDYLRRDGGTIHGEHSTREGCVMLIISSLHDELLPAAAGS